MPHVSKLDNSTEELAGQTDLKIYDNFTGTLAHRPQILRAYEPFREAVLGAGTLDRRVKTMVYMAASYVNESPFDVARSTSIARQEGFSDAEIHAVRMEEDYNFTDLEHAALRMARDLTRTCNLDDVNSNDLSLFSSPQLVELIAIVGLANFDNRFSNALELEMQEAKTSHFH